MMRTSNYFSRSSNAIQVALVLAFLHSDASIEAKEPSVGAVQAARLAAPKGPKGNEALAPSSAPQPSPSPLAPPLPLVLKDVGSADSLLGVQNPWRGFKDQSPVLLSTRLQRIDVPADTVFADVCLAWTTGLLQDGSGSDAGTLAADCESCWASWETWSEDDREAITECDDFPCDVKVDATESVTLKKLEPDARFNAFRTLVQRRAETYRMNGSRAPFEYEGGRAEPWEYFVREGLGSRWERPTATSLRMRKLEVGKFGSRVVRQVLDRRQVSGVEGAAVWLRDVYSTHYFDSWGEWGEVRCDPAKRQILVVLALEMEFDLLKNTDIFTRLAFPRIRTTGQQEGEAFLDRWYERVAPKPSISPSPSVFPSPRIQAAFSTRSFLLYPSTSF